MLQQLINHSPDLAKLHDEGFDIEVRNAHLLVHGIPYVNFQSQVCFGTLVSELSLNGNRTLKPSTHVIYFVGEQPCNKDGSEITAIDLQRNEISLAQDIIVNRGFSNKPRDGYQNYYDKVARYAEIISAPAKSLSPGVSEKTFNHSIAANDDCVFNYADTNSSRAGILALSGKISNQKVAIIGLGGTGSYILDLVAKTNVQEIHLFDGDDFVQHNAFRCPGAASLGELSQKISKVEYFRKKYSNMRKNIFAHNSFVNERNVATLSGFDYVFVSVDRGNIKPLIFEQLQRERIPFTDVGIGVHVVEDRLLGILRATTCTPQISDHVQRKVSFSNSENDGYSTNVQIAELNAFNAVMAVIKWKKYFGFYHDNGGEHDCTYTIDVNMLHGDDYAA